MSYAVQRCKYFLLIGFVAVTNFASAVETNQLNDPQAGSIQRGIERQLPSPNALPTPGPEKKSVEPSAPAVTDVTVFVKHFRFEGVTLIAQDDLMEVLAPWLNKTLNLGELNKAADAVAQLYQQRGFLAQAFIPPQKIEADGVVLIKVIEAKLGAINIRPEGDARMSPERVAKYLAYKNNQGEYVNTKNIEEAIYVLNELPGVAVVTELAAGENEGEIALNVKVSDTALFTGSATASNYGSASTGKEQALANISFNNPLGLGDQFIWNGYKTQGTNYHQATYSLPIHESGLRLGLSGSSMNYATVGDFSGNSGTAKTWGANLSYPLLRSQTTNANVTLGYDAKSYMNYVAGVVNSDYNIHNWTAGFSGNHYDAIGGGGVSTLSLSVTKGAFKNPLWDSSSTRNYGQYVATSFTKGNLGLTRNQQIVPDQTVLNMSLSGQWAGNSLDSVERFYLGGPNGIRAYPQSQGSGDHGAMINFELQQQLPEGIVAYAFYDLGWVQQYKYGAVYDQLQANVYHAKNSYTLSGYGIGAKYNYQKLSLNAFMGMPIGKNPLYRYDSNPGSATYRSYVQQNSDGRSGNYFWLQGVYRF